MQHRKYPFLNTRCWIGRMSHFKSLQRHYISTSTEVSIESFFFFFFFCMNFKSLLGAFVGVDFFPISGLMSSLREKEKDRQFSPPMSKYRKNQSTHRAGVEIDLSLFPQCRVFRQKDVPTVGFTPVSCPCSTTVLKACEGSDDRGGRGILRVRFL